MSARKTPSFKGITGQRFHSLTAIARVSGGQHSRWLFQCDCGVQKIINMSGVLSGRVLSCGHVQKERSLASIRERGVAHHMSGTPEYRAWGSMVQRCTNPKSRCWRHYGGRGITVCERWKDFKNFFADMGLRPSAELELDRIENNGNYEPNNCRWTTRSENLRNRRATRVPEMRVQ